MFFFDAYFIVKAGVIFLIISLIFREICCWYWRINQIVSLLEIIAGKNKEEEKVHKNKEEEKVRFDNLILEGKKWNEYKKNANQKVRFDNTILEGKKCNEYKKNANQKTRRLIQPNAKRRIDVVDINEELIPIQTRTDDSIDIIICPDCKQENKITGFAQTNANSGIGKCSSCGKYIEFNVEDDYK